MESPVARRLAVSAEKARPVPSLDHARRAEIFAGFRRPRASFAVRPSLLGHRRWTGWTLARRTRGGHRRSRLQTAKQLTLWMRRAPDCSQLSRSPSSDRGMWISYLSVSPLGFAMRDPIRMRRWCGHPSINTQLSRPGGRRRLGMTAISPWVSRSLGARCALVLFPMLSAACATLDDLTGRESPPASHASPAAPSPAAPGGSLVPTLGAPCVLEGARDCDGRAPGWRCRAAPPPGKWQPSATKPKPAASARMSITAPAGR